MDEKIKNLWNNYRILFWILFPLIALVVLVFTFRDLILALLIGSARKTSEEAKKQDQTLQNQINEQEKQAALEQQKADDAQKRIDGRKDSDISDDWYKKK